MNTIKKSTSRKELFGFLGTLNKEDIREVISYFNELPESQFPYYLKKTGSKEDLLSGLRSEKSITQKLLYKAINHCKKGSNSLTREEFEHIWKNDLDKSSREVALRYVEAHLTQGMDLKIMASYFIKEKKLATNLVIVCKAYIKYRTMSP